jgi:hypothetical protein
MDVTGNGEGLMMLDQVCSTNIYRPARVFTLAFLASFSPCSPLPPPVLVQANRSDLSRVDMYFTEHI